MMKFEIIGKIKAMKGSDTFAPFEVKDFEKSGWQNTRLKFNVISGTNRFSVDISGGKWRDDSKNRILTRSRAADGKKSENIEIEWSKRRDPDTIEKVAGWKIYTVDLMTKDERKQVEANGTEEEKAAAEKKHYQFLEKTEMAALVNKILTSGKYDDCVFKITGDVDFQYSAEKDIYYRTMSVNKIYKVDPTTAPKAEMTIDTFYTADSVNTDSYDETKKYMFNCYTDYYFSNIKATRFVPMTLVINGNGDEAAAKRAEGFKKKLTAFDDDVDVRKMSLVCDMVDGAETQAITYDDLSDETKEDIEYGLISLDDAIAALGGSMYGSKITETRVKSIARSSVGGSEPTTYTVDDMNRKPVPEAVRVDDAEIDLFADDDGDDFDI